MEIEDTQEVKKKKRRMAIPSKESELTGGLMIVMTATPSAPTSITVLPFLPLLAMSLICDFAQELPQLMTRRLMGRDEIKGDLFCSVLIVQWKMSI